MTWREIETAPYETIIDVLFDPDSYDMPEFYCPEGATTGLWRIASVFRCRANEKWYTSGGLDKVSGYSLQVKLTHWMRLPKPPRI